LSKFEKQFLKYFWLSSRHFIGFSFSFLAFASGAQLALAADDTSQKAIDYFKAGRYELACPLFERLVDRNTNDIRAQYYLALVCQKLGQTDRAIFLFEKIASTSPTSAEAKLSKQAIALMPQGKGNTSNAATEQSTSTTAVAAAAAAAAASPVSSVSSSSSGSSVSRVDEIGYWRQVKSMFPQNELPAILLLKPKYRSAIFSGQSTRATITNAEYTGTQREADERWIQQFQAQESNYKPIKNITVAGYPINSFVGYKVGNSGRFFDGDGFCYKVFF
jgi:tetratricopeptide (TPR) repeat protein